MVDQPAPGWLLLPNGKNCGLLLSFLSKVALVYFMLKQVFRDAKTQGTKDNLKVA